MTTFRRSGSRMDVTGQKALVVGLARSGEAAAELLLKRGAQVTVTDRRSREALGDVASRLQHAGAKLVLGEHPEQIFTRSDLIVVSPGVPRTLAPLEAARQRGIEIMGELELAARYLEAPIVAITGTNGKSTTTTFTGPSCEASAGGCLWAAILALLCVGRWTAITTWWWSRSPASSSSGPRASGRRWRCC